MSEQISRAIRSGWISVLLFGALAAGGVSFGYLGALSSDAASLVSGSDAQHASAVDRKALDSLIARMDPAVD